jgi:hypothetical protein
MLRHSQQWRAHGVCVCVCIYIYIYMYIYIVYIASYYTHTHTHTHTHSLILYIYIYIYISYAMRSSSCKACSLLQYIYIYATPCAAPQRSIDTYIIHIYMRSAFAKQEELRQEFWTSWHVVCSEYSSRAGSKASSKQTM